MLAIAPPIPVLVALLVALIASAAVFVTLTRRWTAHRLRIELIDWAHDNGFRFDSRSVSMPPPLVELTNPHLRVGWILRGQATTLLQLIDSSAQSVRIWNVLIRVTNDQWPPTALRAVGVASSAIDLFNLESFPLLPVDDRYTLVGTDSMHARRLSGADIDALLPANISLLLHGPHLLLDFSGRAFDPIELSRIIGLADQLERRVQTIPEPAANSE